MTIVRSYKDLKVWQVGCELVKSVYKVSSLFPREELYGLAQQIRRAVVSVPSNIAEGYGRGSSSDYLRFLRIARGSSYEVETQLILGRNLDFCDDNQYQSISAQIVECSKMLQGLIKSIEKQNANA
jgi:four helix bundle protein